jgi:hypothetical protein
MVCSHMERNQSESEDRQERDSFLTESQIVHDSVVCVRTPISARVRRRYHQQLSRRAVEVEPNCSPTVGTTIAMCAHSH